MHIFSATTYANTFLHFALSDRHAKSSFSRDTPVIVSRHNIPKDFQIITETAYQFTMFTFLLLANYRGNTTGQLIVIEWPLACSIDLLNDIMPSVLVTRTYNRLIEIRYGRTIDWPQLTNTNLAWLIR